MRGNVRALKVLVIVMGVLIVVGFAVLAGELVRRAFLTADEPEAPLAAGVTLPPGGTIAGITAVGGRLAVAVSLPDGGGFVYLLNPSTGVVLGRIALEAAPDPATGQE